MLELKDFFHLPQLDALVEQLVADEAGLIVVAGLDPRPLTTTATGDGFLPSGRSAIFRILMRQILETHPAARAIVVTDDKSVVRIPRHLRRRVELALVEPPLTYADRITAAVHRRPGLLVIDRLCPETAHAALEAAQGGLRVLSQLDTVFRGADVVRHLLDLGAPQALLSGLRWVIAVGRLATLCPRCKEPAPLDPAQLSELRRLYPTLVEVLETGTCFRTTGCPDCGYTGRHGDVATFDILCADADLPDLFNQPSLLPLEEYVLRLAALGHLPLDDLLRLNADQLRHTYHLLSASERALAEANAALQRKLAELEAANRVLQGRTEALISLQDIGHALISSGSLGDLAARVCRHARDLCGADRAILYFLRSAPEPEGSSPTPLSDPPPSPAKGSSPTPSHIKGSSPTPLGDPTPSPAKGSSPTPLGDPTPSPTKGSSPTLLGDPTPSPTKGSSPTLLGGPHPTTATGVDSLPQSSETPQVEVLAVSGWDPALLHQQLDAALVFGPEAGSEATPYSHWPPGVPPRHPDVEGASLRAGLRVPLIAQGQRVGLMIVHTTQKPGFTPGEVALLQTFANQAALAVQRAGLIDALRAKIAQLEAAQAELVEKERLEREMELARQVQQSVLPRVFPLMPGYTFGACNQPARRVGGDFYDVILLDGDRFGVVVADVSDKGMPAALYMALTRSLLLAEARREPSPRAVLTSVHRLLRELGQPRMFVTVFYGLVDGSRRRLTYARAGHDRPLLLREGTVQSLGGEGTFLGFPEMDDLHLTEEHIELRPGDRLVLYTDGLTDALNPAGRPFGLGRLKATLQSQAHMSPAELCAVTFADLVTYQDSAEQYDDMTMLVVGVSAET